MVERNAPNTPWDWHMIHDSKSIQGSTMVNLSSCPMKCSFCHSPTLTTAAETPTILSERDSFRNDLMPRSGSKRPSIPFPKKVVRPS